MVKEIFFIVPSKLIIMVAYFSSLLLTTPLNGDAGKRLLRLLKSYFKINGYTINKQFNESELSFCVKSSETIYDLREITVAGEDHASYVFSVATEDKKLLGVMMFNVKKILTRFVLDELVKGHLTYKLMDSVEAHFEFDGDWNKAVKDASRTDMLYRFVTKSGVSLEVQPN